MTKEERQKSIEEKMNAVYINKQGIQCRILKYRSFHDVDVIFNDGVIKEHLDCKNLQAGQFSHPKDIPNAENRIGEISYSNDKMEAKIVKYNSSTDFIIQFEDGTEKHLCSWKDFKEGKFSYKYDEGFKLSEAEIKKRKSRLIKNKSGYEMRILNYHSSTDVDVIFEDGTIVKNKIYSNFENGKITHPKYKTLKSDKLKLIQSNGIKDIVRFNNKQDFDVELENGVIVENASFYSCTSGDLAKLHFENNLPKEEIEKRKQTIIKTRGHIAHIKNWHSCLNIDIEFEDGVTIEGLTWIQFIKRKFTYPSEENVKQQAEKYIYKNYKHGARSRKIDFNISKDDVVELIHKPCYLCGRTDLNELKIANGTYRYNGIDRIDNNKGYEIGNVAPCCKDCNRAKADLSLSEFLNLINLIKTNFKTN